MERPTCFSISARFHVGRGVGDAGAIEEHPRSGQVPKEVLQFILAIFGAQEIHAGLSQETCIAYQLAAAAADLLIS